MNIAIPFRPKLFDSLKNYSRHDFTADLIAGLTVGLVALPLAMAFAIASGVPPQAGIFTAVIAGFIISALGGTKVGGPTGAFIVIVYGIYAKYGLQNLALCTVMAGVILLLMGVARLGTMVKFIPYPVTMGFTSGIAVLISRRETNWPVRSIAPTKLSRAKMGPRRKTPKKSAESRDEAISTICPFMQAPARRTGLAGIGRVLIME
jgi:hypothetical protein